MSTGQVTGQAAEIYESLLVPALFREPAVLVARAAGILPGQAVLDVACGTGVLTREAARLALPGGRVVGLDRNESMLAVARARGDAAIEWCASPAERLPFADGSFDRVVSQFGLMFFEDRVAALREAARVTRPTGLLAFAVWARPTASSGYGRMTALEGRVFGEEIAAEMHAPGVLGEPSVLSAVFDKAALRAEVTELDVSARFPSLATWIETDLKGWTLADRLPDDAVARLLSEAERELADLVAPDGSVTFSCPALLALAAPR